MESQTKNCQNCKKDFIIEPDDFAFYEKMKVPAPTFCFFCRVVRRMSFRNERTLYKRLCNAPGHDEKLISIFSSDKKQRVFDQKVWWSDSWDGISYGRDYNFSIPFFTQLKELWADVPDVALMNINPVNSEYCSITEGNKNCYLVIGGDFNENSMYSTYVFRSKECLDAYWVSDSQLNYETIDCISCSGLMYSRYCEGCFNSAFLFNCKNCHDCLGCVNLKNKSYCIFNQQYSKEEYEAKKKDFDLKSYSKVENFRAQFNKYILNFPRKFAYIIRAVNSTGDNLDGTKNCKQCFDVFGGAEDCIDVWLAYSKISDCRDADRAGLNAERVYETSTAYPGNGVYFSRFVFNSRDIYYSYNVHNCDNLFGCVGLRDKHYCIFNKQYTKESYNEIKTKIIEHMNFMPYIDRCGLVYKYGEFFPTEISPFAYNETVAQELVPLTKEEALKNKVAWKDVEDKNYIPTKTESQLLDSIDDVSELILNDIIECSHKGECSDLCTKAFRLIPEELAFYKRMGIPIPRICPNCRHYRRLRQRNPLKLWHRKCMKPGCTNEFETSYAPDRSEIVYCEQCYQQEIA